MTFSFLLIVYMCDWIMCFDVRYITVSFLYSKCDVSNVWPDTGIKTNIFFQEISFPTQNEHISKIIFYKLSYSSSILHPPLPSPQRIHHAILPFPPLTIIIEVHLSEDLICPLLRRGFILWHLHHRWHHLVDGLRDRAWERERKKERDRVGVWVGVGVGRGGRKTSEFTPALGPIKTTQQERTKPQLNWKIKSL